MEEPDHQALKGLFDDLEFRQLSDRLQLNDSKSKTPAQVNQPVQGSLFDMPGGQSGEYGCIENGNHRYNAPPILSG
jgi:hypothetical protein